jgi:hypothetical protein
MRPEPEPRRNWLQRLLARPDAAPRVRRAVGELLVAAVFSIGAIGALVIWHLVRRGRLIRDRLTHPRDVHLPPPGDELEIETDSEIEAD